MHVPDGSASLTVCSCPLPEAGCVQKELQWREGIVLLFPPFWMFLTYINYFLFFWTLVLVCMHAPMCACAHGYPRLMSQSSLFTDYGSMSQTQISSIWLVSLGILSLPSEGAPFMWVLKIRILDLMIESWLTSKCFRKSLEDFWAGK